MAWRALVLADIQTGLSSQELTGIQTYALAQSQPDPTTAVIAASMDQVRGYIAASTPNILGAEGTIPDKLIDCAIDIAVWRLVTRFPTKQLSTPAREKRFGDAIALLKDVARGLFKIETPDVISLEKTAGVILPAIQRGLVRERVWRMQDGMM